MGVRKSKKPLGLSSKIFIALLTGAAAGVLIHLFLPEGYFKDTVLINGILYIMGNGFIRLMQMLVVPLVFCSLVCGSMAIGDTRTLGRVGIKAVCFYLCTTAAAVCTALAVAAAVNPGTGMSILKYFAPALCMVLRYLIFTAKKPGKCVYGTFFPGFCSGWIFQTRKLLYASFTIAA